MTTPLDRVHSRSLLEAVASDRDFVYVVIDHTTPNDHGSSVTFRISSESSPINVWRLTIEQGKLNEFGNGEF
jgi:hypothetical protein